MITERHALLSPQATLRRQTEARVVALRSGSCRAPLDLENRRWHRDRVKLNFPRLKIQLPAFRTENLNKNH